jgi:hypothetical protein
MVRPQDSSTYQAILREGWIEAYNEAYTEGFNEGRILEARRLLLLFGTKRFGEPDARTVAIIEASEDIDRLEDIGVRLVDFDIHNWAGLLGTQ